MTQENHTDITPEKAFQRLAMLCAKREYAIGDVRNKLRTWRIPTEEHANIISKLKENRYIDEARYTELYIEDKLRLNKWGRRKIAQNLLAKGISREIVDEGISRIDQDEYREILIDIINEKHKSLARSHATSIRERLLRFAIGRGFTPSEAIGIIDKLDER